MKLRLSLLGAITLLLAATAGGQGTVTGDSLAVGPGVSMAMPPPAPVTALTGADAPNDHGHAVVLNWTPSADDGAGRKSVMMYEVFRWMPFLFDTIADKRAELTAVQAAREDRHGGREALSILVDALKGNRAHWYAGIGDEPRQLIHGFRHDLDTLTALYSPSSDTLSTPAVVDAASRSLVLQYEGLERRLPTARLADPEQARSAVRTALDSSLAPKYGLVIKSLPAECKKLVRLLTVEFDDLVTRLPEAHAAYPSGGEWRSVGRQPSGATSFENRGPKERDSKDYIPDNSDFYYRVDAVAADPSVRSSSQIFGPVQSYGQLFNKGRVPVLVAVLIFGFLTIFFVSRARGGKELYVRPIGGIEAIDEAIGRATEMGRPILYVLGLGTAADVATIASFTILGRVSKRVAEYQTELIVPTYDPIVMSVAQEVVKSSYLDAGRPDTYKEDIVFFVTQSQFAYVAAVNGIMLRQHPATNVYMGTFQAESLLLAETGVEAGSIQISGTDQIAQLPFFIVACDYTLIGEELYAASAYLGREPILLGSLKAQDYAKAAILVLAIVGLAAANLNFTAFVQLFKVLN